MFNTKQEGDGSKNLQEQLQNDNGSISFDIFKSFDDVNSLQLDWDEFMEQVEGEIFLTYDWCRIWWRYYGKKRDLMIFIFRKAGKICGILPVFSEKLWFGPFFIRVVKMVGTDFMPVAVTIPILKDDLNQVMELFIRESENRCHWHILQLGPICGRFNFLEDSANALSCAFNGSHNIQINDKDVQTYFNVADNWEKQLSELKHDDRRAMKKKYERLIKQGCKIECIQATDENLTDTFDSFVQTHQAYWKTLNKPGHFGAWPQAYECHRDIAKAQLSKQRLRLYEIKLDGKCIGYTYAYKFGTTYYCYLFARAVLEDSEKVDFAKIEFGETVKRAIGESVKLLDSMRGQYDYKLHLGGMLHPIKSLYITKNGMLIRQMIHAFRSFAWILDICYSKLWRARIATRLRVTPGPFWKYWLRCQSISL